jgi:hypothetical protein
VLVVIGWWCDVLAETGWCSNVLHAHTHRRAPLSPVIVPSWGSRRSLALRG